MRIEWFTALPSVIVIYLSKYGWTRGKKKSGLDLSNRASNERMKVMQLALHSASIHLFSRIVSIKLRRKRRNSGRAARWLTIASILSEKIHAKEKDDEKSFCFESIKRKKGHWCINVWWFNHSVVSHDAVLRASEASSSQPMSSIDVFFIWLARRSPSLVELQRRRERCDRWRSTWISIVGFLSGSQCQ